MIKSINCITFKAHDKTYYDGENKIVECYNDQNKLTRIVTYDKFERAILTNWFDEFERDIGFMRKDYLSDGDIIETCKTPTQEYTRTMHAFTKDGFHHRIEKYVSKTRPENNYCHESIRNMFGELVKMISNGKVIFKQ